jgi:phosphatidate cytidylyltransferase
MADPAQVDSGTAQKGAPLAARVSDLRARIGAAIVLMIAALGAAWLGGYWFAGFWLIAAVLVDWEWQTLIGGPRRALRALCGAVGLFFAARFAIDGFAALAVAALAVGAAGAGLAGGAGLASRLMTGAGVFYSGAMLASVCLLRASWRDGLYSIIWLFAVVWGADVMAYFGGRLIGGPKLWPRVSPGKTWAGFVVGVLSGAIGGLVAARATNSVPALFGVGLVAAVVAQAGDLFESALKRRFGVKDSSHLIPGHGGLMDRLDGFIAAALFAALLGAVRHGIPELATGIFQW